MDSDLQDVDEEFIEDDEEYGLDLEMPYEDQISVVDDDIEEIIEDDDEASLKELQEAWHQEFEINQVNRERETEKRKSILARMALDQKACYQCFITKEGHIWADTKTHKVGAGCSNRCKCIFCGHMVIWVDNHGPSIDCSRLPKTKFEFLTKLKDATKPASK